MTLRDRLRSRSQPVRASLRVRLLVGTLAGIAVAIAVAGWALGGLFQQHVAQQFTAQLTTHLDQLTAGLGVDATGAPELASALSDPRFRKPYSGLYWQVDRHTPKPTPGVLRSRSLWENTLALPDDEPAQGEVHRHTLPGPQGGELRVLERTVRELQGVSCISLETAPAAKKQIACTRSFGHPITTLPPLIEAVSEFATRAAEKLRAGGCGHCTHHADLPRPAACRCRPGRP